MTVASETSRVEYVGNGATTAFAVPYYFLANGDLKVYQAGTLKTITTHYTVTGAGNPAGGTVTFVTAPATAEDVVIVRDPAITQTVDYVPNDPFPAETHETALDRLTMIAQRNRDLVDRALLLADGVADDLDLTLPDAQAGYLIGWDESATALTNVSPATIASTVAFGSMYADTFNGDGSTTQFTLTETPGSLAACQVYIGGVRQTPGTDYTVSAGVLTFNAAPPSGTATVLAVYGSTVATETVLENCFAVAASDEITAITTGTAKVTAHIPYAMTITDLYAGLTTPQTSGSIFTVDVNVNGSTILSTKLTINNGEYTSLTAATARVITSLTLAKGDRISVDVDQIGDGTAKGLKVYIVGVPT